MNELESRVAILENVIKKFSSIETTIHQMDKKLDIVALCQADMKPIEQRLRQLEDEHNKAVGGFKTLVFVGSITGGFVGWIVSKITH